MTSRSSDFTLKTLHFKLLALLLGLTLATIARASLRGGCGKVEITPPLGITLIGSKGQPSDVIRDGLFAKAMVLNDGTVTVAVVSVDLLYTPLEEITNPVRTLVRQRTGIAEKNVMVCATHTHSGPEVFTRSKVPTEGRLDSSQIDQSYCRVLVSKIADSVQIAHRNMQEVRIGSAIGSLPEVLYNRRPRTPDGQVQMAFTIPETVAATRRLETGDDGRLRAVFDPAPGESPLQFGPIDPTVLVFRMEDASGRVVGSIIGFGCHPVCIYPFLSTTISADYPAFATRVVEQTEGGTSLFVLGLAGNTVPLRRDVKPCEQLGKALGGEALKRLQMATASGDVALRAATREITLPCKAGGSSSSFTTEIQLLGLGDTWILGLPGEILVEVGLTIKERVSAKNLFVVSLANDVVGYVNHRQAYKEGGYEPGPATFLAEGAGEILIEQALSLIEETTGPGPQEKENKGNK
ncbi:MAG TPA: neutral/alkaline non-lysosomal ceramidase N-terminal domain-containing protein [Sedimentisphaerales bacterium]|nr:neutral/alkaline non-lysosomal ceramidase N-terminal domain-containing protein [Sedimentisphaerales bacterium]